MEIKYKNIWIVSFYSSPGKYDTHLRHSKFAYYLEKKGYKVTIITGSYIHGKNIDLIEDDSKYIFKEYNGIKYIHIKSKHYRGNGLKRMYSLFDFSIKLNKYRNKFVKPDVILHNAHVPFDNYISKCAKKLNAKYIVEIWDLWPESFVTYGLISKNNPLLKLAYLSEKKLYANADSIIFSMEGGLDYLKEKGWNKIPKKKINLDKVYYINNGVDIKDFNYNKQKYIIDDQHLNNSNLFKIVYLGSIGLANNIKLLIDSAKLLKKYSNIIFLIYGDGSEREQLINYCNSNKITNVIFKEKHVSINYVPYIVSSSSLNIVNYKPNAVLKYGGSQGKLFQYLAASKPILSNHLMGYDIISKHNVGLAQTIDSPKTYSDAILSIVELNTEDYNLKCDNARKLVKSFDFAILTDKLIKIIEK